MTNDIENLLEITRIVNIINSGLCKEKYEEWSKYPNPMVRYSLVCNDFKPKLFIYDDNTMIRSEALSRRPDLQKESLQNIINDPNKLEFIEKTLSKQTYTEVLKIFISNCEKYKPDFGMKPTKSNSKLFKIN